MTDEIKGYNTMIRSGIATQELAAQKVNRKQQPEHPSALIGLLEYDARKPDGILLKCQNCGGNYFNITNGGKAVCMSVTKENHVGCGWTGRIKSKAF